MKTFLIYSGVVLALYVAVLIWLLASFPEFDREGAYAMGFGTVLFFGAVASAVLIALGGALMMLWQYFIARNPHVPLGGVVLACLVLAGLLSLGIRKLTEPTYAEKQATQQANDLQSAIQTSDVEGFSRVIIDLMRSDRNDEVARVFAAGPFTEQDFIRHLLATRDSFDMDTHSFFMPLARPHEPYIQTLPYLSRSRYRSFQLFKGEDLVFADPSAEALFKAFTTFHELGDAPEAQRQPENFAPVLEAVNQLSADIRGCGSPLFFLLNIGYLWIFDLEQSRNMLDDDKLKRKSALVLLKAQGVELSAEEKQDAQLQEALRTADLGELLE